MKMKKVLFAMAVAGMFGFAACNNSKPAEEAVENATETVESAACDMASEMGEAVESAADEAAEATSDLVQEVVAE